MCLARFGVLPEVMAFLDVQNNLLEPLRLQVLPCNGNLLDPLRSKKHGREVFPSFLTDSHVHFVRLNSKYKRVVKLVVELRRELSWRTKAN